MEIQPGHLEGAVHSVANQAIPEAGKKPEKVPWTALFNKNREFVEAYKLEKTGRISEPIVLGNHDIDDLRSAWGHCVVGFLAGRFPGRISFENLMNSWGVPCKLVIHSSGWVLFKFQHEADKMRVIGNGPYAIFGRPLILKDMPMFFTFDDKFLSVIPCWINLPGLPLECWNTRSLSKIASAVGVPIAMDRLTAERERISYARVLVEVDTSGPIVESVDIHLPSGDKLSQPVIFETLPKFCTMCKRVGHFVDSCNIDIPVQGPIRRARVRSRSRPRRVNKGPNPSVKDKADIPSASGTKEIEIPKFENVEVRDEAGLAEDALIPVNEPFLENAPMTEAKAVRRNVGNARTRSRSTSSREEEPIGIDVHGEDEEEDYITKDRPEPRSGTPFDALIEKVEEDSFAEVVRRNKGKDVEEAVIEKPDREEENWDAVIRKVLDSAYRSVKAHIVAALKRGKTIRLETTADTRHPSSSREEAEIEKSGTEEENWDAAIRKVLEPTHRSVKAQIFSALKQGKNITLETSDESEYDDSDEDTGSKTEEPVDSEYEGQRGKVTTPIDSSVQSIVDQANALHEGVDAGDFTTVGRGGRAKKGRGGPGR